MFVIDINKIQVLGISLFFFLILGLYQSPVAQSLDGYKYADVYVTTGGQFYHSGNVWQLNSKEILRRVQTTLSDKRINTIYDPTNPPRDAILNPCIVMSVIITHSNNFSGSNEVNIRILNCREETLYNQTGSARSSSTSRALDRATSSALRILEFFRYSFNPDKTPILEFPDVEKTTEDENSILDYLSSENLLPVEGIYVETDSFGTYTLGIIKHDDVLKAIIIESGYTHWKTGEVKAYLQPTSVSNTYSMRWYMRDKDQIYSTAKFTNDLLSFDIYTPGDPQKFTAIYRKVFPTTIAEEKNDEIIAHKSGTGFFVRNDGIIATNSHVINNSNHIEVDVYIGSNVNTFNARILLNDRVNDVALLQIDDNSFSDLQSLPYTIIERADTGESVYTIGYPLSQIMGTQYKVTNGIISSLSGINDDLRYYQITVPLQPGNSGGPLFNMKGEVIGITTARLDSESVGTQVENVNYAIKSSYLLNLMRMLPEGEKKSTIKNMEDYELQHQIHLLKDFVCIIKSY